jgi:UDP-N-acetylmuramyl pentapeptide phosphotransferase/UDP-N-acetylglucosamine-1-phosphate transferase
MLTTAIASFFTSLITALLLIRYLYLHHHLSGDSATQGPQKFHMELTPRIGGIPILLGFLLGLVVAWNGKIVPAKIPILWVCVIVPVFLSGILEDVTKQVSPFWRLMASLTSAALGAWLMGATLSSLALPGLDYLLGTFPWLALLITTVAVGGVCHSINLIDGYNGLAGGVALIILTALGYTCLKVGDVELLSICIVTGAATAGFLAWNYPRGLIFAGDGGAYLLGFIIAEVSVLLVARHPQVSPWFPFTLVMYPVSETIFTIYRRKFVQRQAASLPDALHLHQMIFNRLVRWTVGKREAKHLQRRNSLTTPYLWGMGLMTVIPALLFWEQTQVLQLVCCLFIVAYTWLYRRLVHFKAPKWLITHKQSAHKKQHDNPDLF